MSSYLSTQIECSSHRVGDLVSVRDKQGSPWLRGKVTSTSPLEVQVEGWPMPMSFAFVQKSKARAKSSKWADVNDTVGILEGDILGQPLVRYKFIGKQMTKHVIGKNGKIIEAIRAKTGAKILIFDEDSITEDCHESRYRLNDYYTKIKIVGCRSKCEAVCSLIHEVMTKWREAQNKYRRWLYYSTRTNVKVCSGVTHGACWIRDEYELMKKQHGANGSWFTRKYKNKGRDRSNRKSQAKRKKDYLNKKRKNLRKSGRKMLQQESRRRLSY